MGKSFFEFLYGLPLGDSEQTPMGSALERLVEEAASEESLQIKKDKRSISALLKELEISGDVSEFQGWCEVRFDSEEAYQDACKKVSDMDAVYKLAVGGWVSARSGDEAMSNEAPDMCLKFLDIGEVDASDSDTVPDLEKLEQQAQEPAIEEPENDDDLNPVDHPSAKAGAKTVGVGKTSAGANPKGTPKGSSQKEASEITNQLLDPVNEAQPGAANLICEITTASAVPPVEMFQSGDGLETKGRGGRKLGRKFKMPRAWKQKRPITRKP